MEEIRARLSSARELPSTPEATVRDFPLWLAEVQSEPLHLIVDAANQLHESGAPLSWLPKFIPARVRLVVSTTPGSALNELEARGWSRLHVAPLDRAGRAALIESYLTKSRKRLEPELAARLAADERCAVPLFLCTILEELRLFGRHREIGTWIERLLRARDLGALFEKVLERLEADQGREAVGAMLSTLWASRAGLFEEEIIAITRLSRLARSRLALGLDEHLLRLDGRLIFFHEYLRQAARRRYAPTPETAREAHSRIADYFEGHGSPDRRASELPWQLREIEDWERLKSAASDVGILIEHASRHAWFELLGYWIAAGGLEEMESRYDARLAASIVEGGNDEEQAEALVALSDLFDFSGKYAASARVGERGVAIMEKTVGERHPELGRALSSLGWAELREGRYVDAERHTRRAIAIRESALGAAHPSVARSLDVLASVFWATGNFAESEKHHLRAFAIREATLGSAHPELALSLNNLANDCYCTGRYPEAEEHYRRALQIRRAAFGPAHPDVAASLHDLACVFHATGRYAEAEEHFRRALSIIGRRLVRTLRLWRCC
jgi:tetratricopeptide (TPR) repeat protein